MSHSDGVRIGMLVLAGFVGGHASLATAHADPAPQRVIAGQSAGGADATRQGPPAEQPSTDPPSAHHSLRSRGDDLLDGLHRRGIYPTFGGTGSGSGLGGGVSLRYPRLAASPIGAEVDALMSARGYHRATLRAGWLVGWRDLLPIGAADANITDLFGGDGPRRSGSALYLEASHQYASQVDFFGVEARAPGPRSNYALERTSLDVVGQFQMTPHVGVAGRVGLFDPRVGPGQNQAVPNLEELHDERSAPGLHRSSRMVAVGLAAALDTTGAVPPTAGVFAGVSVWRFMATEGGADTFTRIALDGRVYVPLGSPRDVVAVRLLAAADDAVADRATPFYLQYWLGGSETLRGFSHHRFLGQALVHSSLEYRRRLVGPVHLVPFVDAGATAAGWSAVGRSPVNVTPGLGIHVRGDNHFYLRVDFAHGADGYRLVWSLRPSF
jgi:hypothetical protein